MVSCLRPGAGEVEPRVLLHPHPYKGAPRRQTVSARGDELARRFRGAPSAAPGSCQSTGEQLAVASTSLSAHGPDASSTGRPRCETDMRPPRALLPRRDRRGRLRPRRSLQAFRRSCPPELASSEVLRSGDAVVPFPRRLAPGVHTALASGRGPSPVSGSPGLSPKTIRRLRAASDGLSRRSASTHTKARSRGRTCRHRTGRYRGVL